MSAKILETNTQHLPLSGVKVLITRAGHQSKDFAAKLNQLGATPIELAVIEIRPPDSWQALDEAINNLSHYDWIVLASVNALDAYVARLNLAKRGSKSRLDSTLKCPQIATIGNSTKQAALKHGLQIAYTPDSFNAETFIEQFPGYPKLSGLRFLWPRTNVGRNLIKDELTAAGAKVDIVGAYQTCLPTDLAGLSSRIHKLINNHEIDVITVASSQSATNLAAIISHKWAVSPDLQKSADSKSEESIAPTTFTQHITELLKNITVLSIGPETSEAARKQLGKVDLEASPSNLEGMLAALIRHFAPVLSQNDMQTI